MHKELPKGTAIAIIVAVVLVVALLFAWTYFGGGKKQDTAGELSKQAMEILQRTRGNVQQMTPEERKVFQEAVSRGLVPAAAAGRPVPIGSPNMAPPPGYGGLPPSDVGGMAR